MYYLKKKKKNHHQGKKRTEIKKMRLSLIWEMTCRK